MRLRLEHVMRNFVNRRRRKAFVFTLGNRLSSAPGLIDIVTSGYDMTVAKFHNSPTMYVLFISVSFTKVAPVCVSDSTRWDTNASVYYRLMNEYIERLAQCIVHYASRYIWCTHARTQRSQSHWWIHTILLNGNPQYYNILMRESMVHSMFANIFVDK